MANLKLDPQVVAKLRQVNEKVAIHDESGQIVGYFVSPQRLEDLERERRQLVEMSKELVSDEELERLELEPAEYSMDDVMKLVEKYS